MNISTVLEVAVGLILVYYVLGLIVSYITGEITKWTQLRAKQLAQGLLGLLEDQDRLKEFMAHPLIVNLQPQRFRFWSMETVDQMVDDIPAPTFAHTLFDMLVPNEYLQALQGLLETLADEGLRHRLQNLVEERKLDELAQAIAGVGNQPVREQLQALMSPDAYMQQIRIAIADINEAALREALQGLINQGVVDVKEAQKRVEQWFDDAMVNVSSLYKQNARRIVIVLALVITVVTNADSVAIGQALWEQPTLRTVAAAKAEEFLQQTPGADPASLEAYVATLEELRLPFWWTGPLPSEPRALFLKVAGLVITWVATAQGSSFWYDVLKKVKTPGGQAQAPASA